MERFVLRFLKGVKGTWTFQVTQGKNGEHADLFLSGGEEKMLKQSSRDVFFAED